MGRATLLSAAVLVAVGTGACSAATGQTTVQAPSEALFWLDAPTPDSWNEPGGPVPSAPSIEDDFNARCRELARPAALDEDRRVRDVGWDLIGPYRGGWDVVVIQGAAAYDGMCRPMQYQAFVFVRGAFSGTLSPELMYSRTDGALIRVTLQDEDALTAEYVRYATDDPLCCPSRTTTVGFEITPDGSVVRPTFASTSVR